MVTTGRRLEDARIKTASLHALQEFDPSETVTAFAGARHYSVDAELINSTERPSATNRDSRTLLSAGLVWTPNPDTALRFNVSGGYSYPSLGQLFLETSAAGQTVLGNSALKPETSTTIEIGARDNRGGILLYATAFYTDSEDYIDLTGAGGGALTYTNIAQAAAYGFEVLAESRIRSSNWSPYTSLSYIHCEFDFGNGFTTKGPGRPSSMAGQG